MREGLAPSNSLVTLCVPYIFVFPYSSFRQSLTRRPEKLKPPAGAGGVICRCGERGIIRFAHDPMREDIAPSNSLVTLCVPYVFVFPYSSFRQSLTRRPEKLKPPAGAGGVICRCGERGIRTPVPPEGGKRFSRPSHSTTLASLPSTATAHLSGKGSICSHRHEKTAFNQHIRIRIWLFNHLPD